MLKLMFRGQAARDIFRSRAILPPDFDPNQQASIQMNQTLKNHPLLNLVIGALALVTLAGCKSIGPGTVRRDRLHYSTAVADSWKEQLLLNIVKTRYGDAPAFLEVVSVVSGYTLETDVGVGGQFSPQSMRGDTFATAGGSVKFTDRPTISYSPLTGEKFARSLMAPVPLDSLLFVMQGGAPAEFVLGLTVQSFEGHHNADTHGRQFQPADPQFLKQIQLVGALQRAKVIETEVIRQKDQAEIWLRFHSPAAASPGTAEQIVELKALLGIPAELDRVKIVFGVQAPDPQVIGMRTRSLMHILRTLGAGVQIQPEHLKDGSASPIGTTQLPGGFTVQNGKKKPDDAFVSIPYEGQWFWIDRRDLVSKTTLSAVTIMFNFLEVDSKASPVLTIPTN